MGDDQLIDPAWRELKREQRDVLTVLALDGPDTGAALHRKIRGDGEPQTEGTTHRNLHRLVDRGLVERRASDDDRAQINHLTDEGSDVVRRGLLDPAEMIGRV